MRKLIPTLAAAGACALGGAWTSAIAHADNPCGWDEKYVCEETDYLSRVEKDGIKRDPEALLKAGYAVCAASRPNDQTGLPDPAATRAAVLATGVVTSPQDADRIVSEATTVLC